MDPIANIVKNDWFCLAKFSTTPFTAFHDFYIVRNCPHNYSKMGLVF